jgi:hypothetical protein
MFEVQNLRAVNPSASEFQVLPVAQVVTHTSIVGGHDHSR